MTISIGGNETAILSGHYRQSRGVSCEQGYEAFNASGYTTQCQANRTWSIAVNCTGERSLLDKQIVMSFKFGCLFYIKEIEWG